MTGKIYFQWQNPVLRKTIYPKRDLKLQHFLLYYKEVDLWAEYKDKKIEDLSKEIAEYEAAQKKAISDSYHIEQKWQKHFLDTDPSPVPTTDSQAGKEEMGRLATLLFRLYNDFKTYFDKYEKEPDESRDRKEKNFVATRLMEWEGHLNELTKKITKKKNLLKDPNATNRDIKTRELEFLENTLFHILEGERNKLKEFASAQNKLGKRKEEFAKRVKEHSKKAAEINRVLEPLQKQIEIWETELETVKNTIARLTNPPKVDDVSGYFSEGDIYEKINEQFREGKWKVHEPVLKAVIAAVQGAFGDLTGSFRKEVLPSITKLIQAEKKDPDWLLQQIGNQSYKFQNAQKKLAKVIISLEDGAKSMRAAPIPKDSQEAEVLARYLGDRLATINILSGEGMREILAGELNKLEDLKVALGFLQNDKDKWKKMIQDEESRLEKLQNNIEKNQPEVVRKQKELEPIRSALEIGREKFLSEFIPDREVGVRDIVLYLAEKEKARLEGLTSDQLLHEVFQRFWKEPERFPLWLQYMVIHFSGMRYASAHDSWYDPRALLLDLQTMDIQEGLKNKDDDPSNDTNYEIDDLTDTQVLEKLKAYKDQLPKWMWKEIVEVTDLRLTEVTNEDEDWENLSPEEQKERNSNREKKMGQYREIMERWRKNIAGWRQEHDRANQLIVTRAVCNEVAEHIQHLRGHEGAAGLAQKPGWYMGAESRYYESKNRKAGSRPYFVTAKSRNDFEVGASILWLLFVHEEPNQWRVAKPLETREGDGLIPKAYLGRNSNSGGWAYKMGEPIVRTRNKTTTTKKKGSSKAGRENQWLRWMHEATVVEVAETAETGNKDKVVLTFETALPSDDPSQSTIGLFKRYLSDLTREQVEDNYNAAFVGFMPEAELPADAAAGLASDLEEMLDWNHILQKGVVSAAELEAYRNKHIRNRKPPKPTIEILHTTERVKGKADLPICDFVKWTDSLVTPDNNLWKVRIWGDTKLGRDVKDLQTDADSNFQAVGVYIKETQQSSGVANALKIEREDIDKLIAMQIEDEFARKRTDRKRLEIWREQKMNWLCKKEGTVYFTKDGGKGWDKALSILWGIIALGGNLVQVEGEEEMEFEVDGVRKNIKMARLAGFKKKDWYRPLDELLADGLVHRCFCVYGNRNKPIDTPMGIIYSPFFSPLEWTFAGRAEPKALYLPFDYLVKPGSKDEEGKVYEGIAEKLKCKT